MQIVYKKSESIPPRLRRDEAERNHPECKKFMQWMQVALPGERYCYFTGNHISDNLIARTAMNAFERGAITLFQKRLENGISNYLAVKLKNEWR